MIWTMLATAYMFAGQAGPDMVALTGHIRDTRGGQGTNVPILMAEGEVVYTLHGRDAAFDLELRRLAGTRVQVFGVLRDPQFPGERHVLVQRYEILDVGGGVRPRIGHLATLELEGKMRLIFVDDEGRADLLPDDWMKKMERHRGSKLWMVGSRNKSRFVPTRFSVIRPRANEGESTVTPPRPQK